MKFNIRLALLMFVPLAFTCMITGCSEKSKAPVLPTLTRLDGTPFDQGTLEGKVYIISYFQTWCSDCAKEQPQLQKLQDKFGRDKLSILMISDERTGKIDSFRQKFNSGLDFYHSTQVLKSREVGVKKFPTTYLISKKGRVEEVKIEGIKWYTDEIVALVEKLVND